MKQASRFSKAPYQRKQIDLNLAMVHGVSGDFDTARDVAGKYLEGPALDNNLGLYAHLAKDDSLAKSYLNMALTQSPTYYERAWENLDVVNDTNQDAADDKLAPRAKSSAGSLPKLDALRAPETKTKRKGSKVTAPVAKATANATEVEPAQAVAPTVKDAEVKPEEKKPDAAPDGKADDKKTEAKPEVKADDKKPEAKSEDKKPDEKPEDKSKVTDKPAGLIVGPGEGD